MSAPSHPGLPGVHAQSNNTLNENLPRVDLSNCEKEPIHIPGMIQPHGALIVADVVDLRVAYASANAATFLGVAESEVLGKPLRECLHANVYRKLIVQDEQGSVIFEPLRTHHVLRGSTLLYFEVRQFNDLLYIEMELDASDPNAESLPAVTQRMVGSMRSAPSLRVLLKFAATELRRLTGYDRVMMYEFAEDGHGVVVAEDCEPSMDPYLGLHYPASDIPAQARRLYLMQRIRVIADTDYLPLAVLADPQLGDATGNAPPLDMTFCNLRSVSPIHLEYLRNMGVSATMTLSVIVDDDLWGMLVCHHRTPRLPSAAIRSSCDLISQMTSFLIRARLEMDTLEESQLATSRVEEIAVHLEQQKGICEGLTGAEEQLLPLVGATGALIRFEGKSELIGKTPTANEAIQLMNRLHGISGGKVFAHNSLCELQPEFASLKASASGVMLMPILGSPENAILWFRPEFIETVNWGGNPNKAAEINPETLKLSPRKSFHLWKTQVEKRSQPWCAADFRAANELRRTISDHLLSKAEGTFSNLGLIDTLTLLPNRRRFQNELRIRSENTDTSQLSVILVNLDRFKQVNDAFGHATGDQLLIQVARRLAKLITTGMLLSRLGADEFAVLCGGVMAGHVDEVALQITSALASPFQLSGKPFRITASLGIAHASHGETELLRAADTAMHSAKRKGRNQLVAFNKQLQDSAVRSLELQQEMYRALEAHEFKPMYQPIVALPEGRLHGFEALLRWHHPIRGMISPLDFIPLAEETGLILPIGLGVLREALHTTRRWTERYGFPIKMHVNVAASQLVGASFVQDVTGALREAELSADALSIEVTESVLMRDSAVESLHALKALGIEVSIDDFGTGYSSLAYLQKLPVDIVKIDKTFINDIAKDRKSRDYLGSLLMLTRTLGLEAIAEGVETAEQRDVLVDLACKRAQGYLFARPLAAQAAEALLAQHAAGSLT